MIFIDPHREAFSVYEICFIHTPQLYLIFTVPERVFSSRIE